MTRSGRLPMGGPLRQCVYLAPLWKYGASVHVHTYTKRRTHTRNDGQNEKSLNLL